eukprot:4108690-Pyramimonas_sp.AAC.1
MKLYYSHNGPIGHRKRVVAAHLSAGYDVAVADGGHRHHAPVEGHGVQVPGGGEVVEGAALHGVVLQVVALVLQR